MNREEFISYLREPASLDKKSLPEINELIEEFPFFQSGHLLFLKNLNNLDHIRFGSQLKKSSSIVSNRERLYDLLFPAIEMDAGIVPEGGIEARPPTPVIDEADLGQDVEKALEEKSSEVSHDESDRNVKLEEVEEEAQKVNSEAAPIQENIDSGEDKSTDDLREQVERRLAEIRGETPPEVKAKSVLEKPKGEGHEDKEKHVPENITPEEETNDDGAETEAMAGIEVTSGVDEESKEEKPGTSTESIENGVLKEEESLEDHESHTNDKSGDQDIVKDNGSSPEEKNDEAGELLLLGDEKEVGDPGQAFKEEVDERDALFIEGSLLDLDYPSHNENLEDTKDFMKDQDGEKTISTDDEVEKEVESGTPEDKIELKEEIHSFESWLNLLGTGPSEEDPGELKEPVSGQRNIIDKFILENPRIQPGQDDYFGKGDMSADSVTEKDELFTETLANIYIKQGYYSRAIFFYQELSLKFPEKSTYFARRIKEIEKRINKL